MAKTKNTKTGVTTINQTNQELVPTSQEVITIIKDLDVINVTPEIVMSNNPSLNPFHKDNLKSPSQLYVEEEDYRRKYGREMPHAKRNLLYKNTETNMQEKFSWKTEAVYDELRKTIEDNPKKAVQEVKNIINEDIKQLTKVAQGFNGKLNAFLEELEPEAAASIRGFLSNNKIDFTKPVIENLKFKDFKVYIDETDGGIHFSGSVSYNTFGLPQVILFNENTILGPDAVSLSANVNVLTPTAFSSEPKTFSTPWNIGYGKILGAPIIQWASMIPNELKTIFGLQNYNLDNYEEQNQQENLLENTITTIVDDQQKTLTTSNFNKIEFGND